MSDVKDILEGLGSVPNGTETTRIVGINIKKSVNGRQRQVDDMDFVCKIEKFPGEFSSQKKIKTMEDRKKEYEMKMEGLKKYGETYQEQTGTRHVYTCNDLQKVITDSPQVFLNCKPHDEIYHFASDYMMREGVVFDVCWEVYEWLEEKTPRELDKIIRKLGGV